MEVKPGYKQSEIGVIPENWVNLTVGQLVREEIIEKPLDGNHGNIHPKSDDFVYYGIPFVMANNVQGGKLDLENCSFIRKEQADSLQKGFSRPGDVLLTHKATIGNTAIVGEIHFDYIMLTPQVTYYRVIDENRLYNVYLRHYFDSNLFQSVMKVMAGGGTRSYIGIKAQHQLPLVLPPIKEQHAIATALSDVDTLIASLDKLIAKKRAIKTATMQQLLTGKKRLPGFSGEWEVTSRYKQTEMGMIPEDWHVFCFRDNFIIYAGGDVPKDSLSHIKSERHPIPIYANATQNKGLYGFTNERRSKPDSVTITARGYLGHAEYRVEPFFPIVRLLVLEPLGSLDSKYTAYAINDRVRFPVESTGVPQLTAPQVGRYSVAAPSDISEQRAIATVLSDMDAEINALEARRDKTKAIKQGMMQELLTGRTRLI